MKSNKALEAFIAELRKYSQQLRAGKPGPRKLEQFRSFRWGEDDAFYPIDDWGEPWKRHRVAISRATLTAAGYEDYSRWLMPGLDPWRHVRFGGEVPLWQWGDPERSERKSRVQRAALLERLATLLERDALT